METQIVEGFAGASHVKGAPLTTTITREVSEELLRNLSLIHISEPTRPY